MEYKITIDININIKDGLDKVKINKESLEPFGKLIGEVFSSVTKPIKHVKKKEVKK